MSGIYGYCLKGSQNAIDYDRALTYWNSVYGKSTLHMKEKGKMAFSVNLDHFSLKVPEQTDSLDTPSHTAVIDALIYNRDELSRIYSFDISLLSDEQLIFKIITEHGIKALADINGDFAGVLYDKNAKTFTLFRDHMGVRPLFYYITKDCFVFSTDMRAFPAIPELKLSINDKYLFMSITDQLVTDDNDFIFNEIHVVKYASWSTITEDTEGFKVSEPKPYWTLGQHKIRLKDERAYQLKLRELVEESIKNRMNAVDGLIGAELSGGMDSSIIGILIHRLGREGRYFSWSLSPEAWPITRSNDERLIISAVCEQEAFSVRYDSADLAPSQENVFLQLTPPFSGTMTIRNACKWFHSQGVKAVFTGHGGDEGVSHRARPYELLYYKEYSAYFNALYNIRKTDGINLPLLRSVRAFIRDIFTPYEKNTLDNDEVALKEFMNPTFYQQISENGKEIPYTFGYDVKEYLKHGFHTNRPMDTAYQGAAYGVRYLYPYLDYRVMDYAVSIPRRLYTNGIRNRIIYIEAFRDLMPKELLELASKRIPSMIHNPTQGDKLKRQIQSINSQFHWYVSQLDPKRWSPFLDFEKLNNYNIPEDSTYDELRAYAYRNNNLIYCVKVQKIWDHAIDPVLDAEKAKSSTNDK